MILDNTLNNLPAYSVGMWFRSFHISDKKTIQKREKIESEKSEPDLFFQKKISFHRAVKRDFSLKEKLKPVTTRSDQYN
jgi:hypothetical protein